LSISLGGYINVGAKITHANLNASVLISLSPRFKSLSEQRISKINVRAIKITCVKVGQRLFPNH